MSIASEWVIRLLRPVIGDQHRMVALKDAKIERSSGVGLPYKWSGFSSKGEWLDSPCAKVLLTCVEDFSEPYSLMWDCFPKVEILRKEKADRKSRLISAAPIEHYIVGAMLYTTQNEALYSNPLKGKSAVGLCPAYRGWQKLAALLGESVENSDATGFDQSLSPALLYRVYEIRERLSRFTEAEKRLHWWYFMHLIHRRCYTSNGKVFDVYGGNGSGQYNTTSDNTLAHILALGYAAVRSGMSFVEWKESAQFVYGDDYIGTAVPEGYWQAFSELGIRLKRPPPTDIFGVDFLSHKFVMTPWGITGVLSHNKSLLSAYTSESKRWIEFRLHKLYSLWLGHYFHGDGVVYKACLEELGYEVRDIDAISYWFGLVGGFKSQYGKSYR